MGQTPWSARVPLDPLVANRSSAPAKLSQADEGVGCRPGVCPTLSANSATPEKLSRIAHSCMSRWP